LTVFPPIKKWISVIPRLGVIFADGKSKSALTLKRQEDWTFDNRNKKNNRIRALISLNMWSFIERRAHSHLFFHLILIEAP
jgi:hypothetical protein